MNLLPRGVGTRSRRDWTFGTYFYRSGPGGRHLAAVGAPHFDGGSPPKPFSGRAVARKFFLVPNANHFICFLPELDQDGRGISQFGAGSGAVTSAPAGTEAGRTMVPLLPPPYFSSTLFLLVQVGLGRVYELRAAEDGTMRPFRDVGLFLVRDASANIQRLRTYTRGTAAGVVGIKCCWCFRT